MTVYEFNKAGYTNLPSYTAKQLQEDLIPYVSDFLSNHDSKYYMMLNHEERYFTIYTFKEEYHRFRIMAKEIIDIVKDLGPIKSIEYNEDNQILEFWIMRNGECKMFALFDYSRGVVEI
jgi:hypothetical protein